MSLAFAPRIRVDRRLVRKALRAFAELVEDQPDNDTVYELVQRLLEEHGEVTGELLERHGIREVSLVLCVYPGGRTEILSTKGSFSYVDENNLIDMCVESGGTVALTIHLHPGGPAAPSAGDVRELVRLLESGKLKPGAHFCIARIGKEGGKKVLHVTCIVPKTAELQEFEIPCIEDLSGYVEEYGRLEVRLSEGTVTSIYDDETSSEYEEVFRTMVREDTETRAKISVRVYKIPLE